MVKITWSKLEKDDPIFTERFETYSPRSKSFVKRGQKKLDPKNTRISFIDGVNLKINKRKK